MKIEQVLIHYLLKNKELTLEGIGTFKLEAALPDTADPDRPILIPADAISFHFNPRATADEGLVAFISEYTGKIKPLAASDLDSYLALGRQFLNIGNPFILHNIGTLQKNNSGELIFKGGNYAADKINPQKKIEDEGAEVHDENMFNDYQRPLPKNNGKALVVIGSIVILALLGWAAWYFIFNQEVDQIEKINSTENIQPINESPATPQSPTSINSGDSSQASPYTFKIVVNEYDNVARAHTRANTLQGFGRNVIVYSNDSINYKVAEPFTRPLSDTLFVLDSLSKYYGRNMIRIDR